MSFFKWVRKKEEEPDENEPVLAAVIKNPVTSEIFQDILKENGIPFIWYIFSSGPTTITERPE